MMGLGTVLMFFLFQLAGGNKCALPISEELKSKYPIDRVYKDTLGVTCFETLPTVKGVQLVYVGGNEDEFEFLGRKQQECVEKSADAVRIAIVKHPYLRLVQLFEWERRVNDIIDKSEEEKGPEDWFDKRDIFKTWITAANGYISRPGKKDFFRPQLLYLLDANEQCDVDYIISLENFDEEFAALQASDERLKGVSLSLQGMKLIPKDVWCTYYDEKSFKTINDLHSMDFVAFKAWFSDDYTQVCPDAELKNLRSKVPSAEDLDHVDFPYVEGACQGWGTFPGDVKYLDKKCFDVNKCAESAVANGKAGKKYALVLTHSLENIPRDNKPRFKLEALRSFIYWMDFGVDVIVLVPKCGGDMVRIVGTHVQCSLEQETWHRVGAGNKKIQGIHPFSEMEKQLLQAHGVKIHEVPWMVPPNTSKNVDGCGPKDLIRLHLFGATQYDAAIYYDWDVVIKGDIMPIFQCVASGEFLMTTGPSAFTNAGFMGVKPEKDLMDMTLWFAERATLTDKRVLLEHYRGGWGGASAYPSRSGSVGFSCGQGFIWALIYGNGLGTTYTLSSLVREAHRKFPKAMKNPARLVDRCLYNYQSDNARGNCAKDFSCKRAVALHKTIKPEHKEKQLREFPQYEVCFKPDCTNDTQVPACAPAKGVHLVAENHLHIPLVYVYQLENKFRDNGVAPNCATLECIFGAKEVLQYGQSSIQHSDPQNLAWMIYYRLKNSSFVTKDVEKATFFFVPAWSSTEEGCPEEDILFEAMKKENPALASPSPTLLHRHILLDPRLGRTHCKFMSTTRGPLKFSTRLSPVVDPAFHDVKSDLDGSEWFSFPFVNNFHGAGRDSFVALRLAGKIKPENNYLWSYAGKSRGLSSTVHDKILQQCKESSKCFPLGDVTSVDDMPDAALTKMALESDFCIYPPGSGPTRKGFLNSLVLGCVPVFFLDHQLSMFRGHLTHSDFASMSVRIPRKYLPGAKNYVDGGDTIETLLGKIPKHEVMGKRLSIARMAHRIILASSDSDEDALSTVFMSMAIMAPKKGWI
eukprot:m.95947 g.95947  ORF g.95947 m.95947 type:complete len:1031 (-) comp13522_c0_seq2:376-3468(-)